MRLTVTSIDAAPAHPVGTDAGRGRNSTAVPAAVDSHIQESVMKAKQVFATIAIALGSGTVLAIEATQLEVPPSTLTREEVRAGIEEARRDGTLMMSGGEATVFVDRPVASERTREAVRREGSVAMRNGAFDDLYAG
jgi:hypothetical protein